MDLPRQPKPVFITFEGEQVDIEDYIERVRKAVEHGYTSAQRVGNTIVIHPAAVND